jgi:hypothetical protein
MDLELSTRRDTVGFIFSTTVVFIFGLIINNSNKNKEIDLSANRKAVLLPMLLAL